jgi:hypothetical protein
MDTPANLVYYRGDLRSCWSPPTGNAGDPRKPGFRAMNPNRKYRAMSAVLTVILALAVPASAEWKEKVLYSFQGGTNDGALPVGGVVFGIQGNLYGVLQFYGPGSCGPIANECGAVFQLAPPAHQGDPWTETLIYEFQGKGGNDGESPNGGLVIDGQGNLYGVTAYGGTGDCVLLGVPAGCGTVYEVSPPAEKGGAWKETILYSFPTAEQGYFPNGNLVFDGAGNLYGATTYGGGKGTTCDSFYGGNCGTVFKLSPPKTKGGKWTEKVLHSFASGTDGANPNGGLVLDGGGNVYGTTFGGGNESGECGSGGCGTAFELKPPTKKHSDWTEKQLHVFADGSDGAEPTGNLIFNAKGSLFGTAQGGNPSGGGIAFQLTANIGGRWKETVLRWFSNNGPGAFTAGLIFDSSGNLYGPTDEGALFRGTVVRLKRPARQGGMWVPTIPYTFQGSPDGAGPAARLIFDAAGNLYSTTQAGGTGEACQGGCGTVYEASP